MRKEDKDHHRAAQVAMAADHKAAMAVLPNRGTVVLPSKVMAALLSRADMDSLLQARDSMDNHKEAMVARANSNQAAIADHHRTSHRTAGSRAATEHLHLHPGIRLRLKATVSEVNRSAR